MQVPLLLWVDPYFQLVSFSLRQKDFLELLLYFRYFGHGVFQLCSSLLFLKKDDNDLHNQPDMRFGFECTCLYFNEDFIPLVL